MLMLLTMISMLLVKISMMLTMISMMLTMISMILTMISMMLTMISMMLTMISVMLTMTHLADNLKTGARLVILVCQGTPEPVSHSQHRHWRIWETNVHLAKHETDEINMRQVR